MSARRSLGAARLLNRCRKALGPAYWLLSPAVRGRTRPADLPDRVAAVPFEYDVRCGASGDPALCVVCHLFHDDLARELRLAIENIPFPCAVFVSTDTDRKRVRIEKIFRGFSAGAVKVETSPNRGRDIAAKLVTFREVYRRYDYVLFVHGKKSATSDIGDAWRAALLDSLVGSPDVVASIVSIFEADESVGVVLPRPFPGIRGSMNWGHNFAIARSLARRMDIRLTPENIVDFPAGSMFWARTDALSPLLGLNLDHEDFPAERGQTRMTLQHALERLVLFACEKAGFRWVKVAREGGTPDGTDLVNIRSRADLVRFLAERPARLIGSVGARR